jgi:hypothetical protein
MLQQSDTGGRSGLTDDEMRANLVRLAFGGDEKRLEEFCAIIHDAIPGCTAAVLRGSAITGERWKDGAGFDADGPGTSDLDLTLVGDEILKYYELNGFYVPGVHSRPLGEGAPDVAPRLVPLRNRLMELVGRPVNIQGTRDWVMFMREQLFGQPYLTIVGKTESA